MLPAGIGFKVILRLFSSEGWWGMSKQLASQSRNFPRSAWRLSARPRVANALSVASSNPPRYWTAVLNCYAARLVCAHNRISSDLRKLCESSAKLLVFNISFPHR